MRNLAAFLAGLALLSGGVASAAPAETAEAKLARALDGRVAGAPVHCLNFNDIRSTRIIDGTAILYEGGGGRLYVNRPASGASSLRSDNVLVTKTSMSQLCNVDVVQLYDTASRMPTGWVGLGDFVPYTKAAKQN